MFVALVPHLPCTILNSTVWLSPHAALEFAGVIPGDSHLVKEPIFLWIVPIFNHLMKPYIHLVMNF